MQLYLFFLRKSYKQNFGRIWLSAIAVAVGVMLMLTFLSVMNGISGKEKRYAWQMFATDTVAQQPLEGVDPLLIALDNTADGLNKWGNKNISIYSLYARGSNAPQLSGLKTPGAGEFYASPQLVKLIQQDSTGLLTDRLSGTLIGTIPSPLLASPEQLLVIRGLSDAEMQKASIYHRLYPLYSIPKDTRLFSNLLWGLIVIGIIGLLIPVVMFISAATRFGSVQRSNRYAALRLVGATRQQITGIAAAETMLVVIIGLLFGSLLYLAFHPILAGFRLSGSGFFLEDMWVKSEQLLLIAAVTILAAFLANRNAMRSVQNSPLGVILVRKVERTPSLLLIIPLISGLALLFFIFLRYPSQFIDGTQDSSLVLLLVVAFVLISLGVYVAGPLLTKAVASIAAGLIQRPEGIIATKRIALYPYRSFAAISGVILALFMGSYYFAMISGMDKLTAIQVNMDSYSLLQDNVIIVQPPSSLTEIFRMDDLRIEIESLENVQDTAILQKAVASTQPNEYILPCLVARKYTSISCSDGGTVIIDFSLPIKESLTKIATDEGQVNAGTAAILVKFSDQTDATLERIRNLVNNKGGGFTYNDTTVVSGKYAKMTTLSTTLNEFSALAYFEMIVTMVIAAASLMVTTLAGLLERKRSFFTLRLSGMKVNQLRKVVLIESLAPLFGTAFLATILGFVTGVVFVKILFPGLTVEVPSWKYFLVVGVCLLFTTTVITLLTSGIKNMTSIAENHSE